MNKSEYQSQMKVIFLLYDSVKPVCGVSESYIAGLAETAMIWISLANSDQRE